MTNSAVQGDRLPVYRIRAVNTSPDSENKIHDDDVAARHGFRGGLVPGVAVYGYMTVALVERFSLGWLERGSMQVRFHKPFFEGDLVVVRSSVVNSNVPVRISIAAEREDGAACATGLATVGSNPARLSEPLATDFADAPLPPPELRPVASSESLEPGTVLGSIVETFDSDAVGSTLLKAIGEDLPVYFGREAVAHPAYLLGFSNQLLMRNFKLGPWIHAASDIANLGVARNGDELVVRGRIAECYERKGRELVVLDAIILANGDRPIQRVRHTAIYRLRPG